MFFILDSTSKTQDLILPCQLRSTLPNLRSRSNVQFSCKCLLLLLITVFTLWLTILLICSGDIHPNPGPSSIPSSLNSSTSHNHSNNSLRSPNLSHNLSFVHYNVQSILNKLDILEAELFELDILAFTETWINPTVQSDDLVFQTFHKPERKDRRSDHFGGLLLYVKSGIFYKRRSDLEINGIECIWIEVVLNKKSLLFGLFYRPPNSSADVYSNIEESISLAVDTGTSDWWSTLKTFISPNLNSAIPPIESEGIIHTDDFEKANLFNNYFQGQTVLDDSNAVLPELPEPSYLTSLSSIAFDPQEVEEILRTLKTDKASGPDGLSNRILKELSHELSSPLCSLFNKSLSLGKFPSPYKECLYYLPESFPKSPPLWKFNTIT